MTSIILPPSFTLHPSTLILQSYRRSWSLTLTKLFLSLLVSLSEYKICSLLDFDKRIQITKSMKHKYKGLKENPLILTGKKIYEYQNTKKIKKILWNAWLFRGHPFVQHPARWRWAETRLVSRTACASICNFGAPWGRVLACTFQVDHSQVFAKPSPSSTWSWVSFIFTLHAK